jgi:ABC-type amino acid transport substrate-binding protein
MGDYELPCSAGFRLKKNALGFLDFVDQTPLKLKAPGEVSKICDSWFAQAPWTLQVQSH